MFGGEFSVTLDDASRIALPRRIREALETDKVVVTKGIDSCLWLYTTGEWEKLANQIAENTDFFIDGDRFFRQRILGPNHLIDIDRQGRILIPPLLRSFAGLNRDCILLGQLEYIEIWDVDRYQAHAEKIEEDFKTARRKLGVSRKKEKERDRERELGYDSPRSGAAGTGSELPGSQG
jgi:MraZ protein